MPALPAGLKNSPTERASITTTGWFQNTSGTSSGTKLQAMRTVSQPVGTRSMIRGAAMAPRMPQAPAAVETRPMVHGANPAWISRRSAATKIALTTRLEHIPHSIRVRKNGRLHWNRKPSATSARALRRSPLRGAGERSVRSRPSSTHETAKVTASKRKGAHRVIP